MVNGEDLAHSIEKVGEAAAQSGTSMHELNGITTALVQATGLEGSEAGTSIRAILSRTYGLGRDGEDGKGIKGLKEYANVDVRDSSGEFKSFSEILNETNKAWVNMSGSQRMALAQAEGGREHYSQFMTIMNNYATVVKATNTSINSQGSALQENEKYLSSTEGKLNQLKVASERLANDFISSDTTKGFIDFAKGVVNGADSIVKVFGSIPTVIGLASSALLAFNKNLQVFSNVNGSIGINKSIKESLESYTNAYTKNLEVIQKSNLTYLNTPTLLEKTSASMKSLKSSTIATTLATTAFNAVIGMGIGLAIGATITGIQKLINYYSELDNKNKELMQSQNDSIQGHQSNITQLEAMKKQYTEVENRMNSMRANGLQPTIEDTNTMNELNNKIAKMMPELVSGYDSQGNAIVDLAGNYDTLINKQKEAIKNDALKTLTEAKNPKEVADNKIKSIKKDENFDSMNFGQRFLNNLPTPAIGGIGGTISDVFISQIKGSEKLPIDKQELYNQKLKDTQGWYKQYIPSILQVSDGYSKLDNNLQRMVANYANANISFKDMSIDDIRAKIEVLTNNLNKADAQPIIKQIEELNSNAKNMSLDEYNKKLVEFLNNLSNITGIKKEDLQRVFNIDLSSLKNNVDNASDSINNLIQSEEDLQKSLSSNLNKIVDYGKMLNEIKDKGTLSTSSRKSIIDNNPELIPYLSDMSKLTEELTNKITDLKSKSKGAFVTIKVQEEQKSIQDLIVAYNELHNKANLDNSDKQKLSQTVESLQGKIQGLIVSKDAEGKATISNIKLTDDRVKSLGLEQKFLIAVAQVGVNKAKDMITAEVTQTKITYEQLQKRIEGYMGEYKLLQAISETSKKNGDDFSSKIFQQGADTKYKTAIELQGKLNEVNNTITRGMEDLGSTGRELDDITNNLTEDTNKNTKSNKENTEMVKTAKNELKSYENAIKDCDIALKELNYTMGKMYEGSQKYIDSLDKKKQLLQEELNLTKQAIEANSANANSLRDVASATTNVNKISSTGKTTGKYADFINEASAKYGVDVNLIKAIIQQESNWNPNVVSSAGAKGLMQKMEGTNLFDPRSNIMQGTEEIARDLKMFNGDVRLALAAYNAGPGNVQKYGGIPPFKETQNYIPSVLNYYKQYSGGKEIPVGGNTTLDSGAEDIASRIESLKSKALELQEAIDKIALEKFNAKIKQFDDQLAHVDRNKEMAKTSYDIDKVNTSKDGIEKAMKEKEQIWKEINWHYNVLTQKEAYINKELESTAYDEKTRTEMLKALEEVKIQMESTVVELHQEFQSWQEEIYNNAIKLNKDNIDDLERKLNIVDKLSTKNYDEKISLNNLIINQNEQIKQKTLDQINALQKLVDTEKEDTTRALWIDQQNKLLDQLDEINAKTIDIQQKNIELVKNKAFDAIEKQIYNGKTQEQYENNIKKQINALDDELEVMQKQNDALQERETRQKNLLDIAEAQIKLQEAQNNKNVQQLTKDSSGNWNFTYVANQQNVDSLEKELRDKMKSNSDWEKQTSDKHKQDSLNEQKKALQDEINIRKEALDSIKHNIEIALQDQNNLFANGGANLNNIVNDSLSQLNSLYNGKFSGIVSTVRSAVSQISSSILDMNTQIANSQKIIEDINNTTAQGKNNTVWVTKLDSPDGETAQQYYSKLGYNIKEINDNNYGKVTSDDVLLGLAGTKYGDKTDGRKVVGADKNETAQKAQKDALELLEKAGRESVEIEEKYSNQSTQVKQSANNRNTIIVKNATTGETMTIQKGANTNMNIIRQSWNGIVDITNDKMGNMVVIVKGKVEEASAELRNLIALQEQAGLSSGGSRSQENHVKVMPGVDPHAPTTSIYIKDGITYYYDSQHPLKFAKGGETQRTGLHWLDGNNGEPERVLSIEQTKSFNNLVFKQLPELKNIIPSLSNLSKIISNIQLPKINLPDIGGFFNGNNQQLSTPQGIFIEKLEFPNVTNGQEVVDTLKNICQDAIQYANGNIQSKFR